jgi:hypothetical protein
MLDEDMRPVEEDSHVITELWRLSSEKVKSNNSSARIETPTPCLISDEGRSGLGTVHALPHVKKSPLPPSGQGWGVVNTCTMD